ncbi:hypothetical protein PLICRDRAFT_51514 [Plicaturopsis crispa FD-325 SS-3]|nr:hypothetical protein PLICRDRAFT_51514 [Plicaturopsis crispa FD-325 SS-3]
MSPSQVPSEIIDEIIDYLHDDVDALRACALTCRVMLPASRYHLFSSITVHSQSIETSHRRIAGSHGPLVSFASYARNISLCGFDCRSWKRGSPLARLRSLVPLLPAIDSVELAALQSFSLPALAETLRGWHIRHLRLVNFDFARASDFVNLVGDLPNLETISADYMSWGQNDLAPDAFIVSTIRRAPLRFTIFSLLDLGSAPILQWILGEVPTPRIHTLHVGTKPYAINALVTRLIFSVGPTLEHLHIWLPTLGGIDHVDAFDLSACTHLRSLHIHDVSCTDDGAPMSRVLRLLSTVTANTIEEVEVSLIVSHRGDLDCIDWECFRSLLLRPPFQNLKSLTVPCIPAFDPTDATEVIERMLQPFKHILCFPTTGAFV